MHERLSYLYTKYRAGQASREELLELLTYLEEGAEKESMRGFLFEQWEEAGSDAGKLDPATLDAMTAKIFHPRRRQLHPGWKMLAAACVLALVSTLLYKFWPAAQDQIQALPATRSVAAGIPPARKAARLVLDDGTVKYIDSLPDGWALAQGNAGIQRNGQLLQYTESAAAADRQVRFNTLSTAMGETFPALQLADGTKVWLNAGSSIRFPVSFNGQAAREVEVTGELYFEVAKDKTKPFLVHTAGDTVAVLGTHFNVNSYADESHQKITLLEGSVAVRHQGKHLVLKPGEAALSGSGDALHLVKADTLQAIAWKDNLFFFDQTDIASAMRQVARWYDLDIVCTGNGKRTITGQLPRSVPAATLFKALELSGNIKYKMEGRYVKITI